MKAEQAQAEWRTIRPARVTSGLLAALVTVISLGSITGLADAPMAIAFSLAWNVVTWLMAFRPRLVKQDADTLRVVNPWSTHTIHRAEVKSVEPGYDGLKIRRHGKRGVSVWAVQESNFKMFTGGTSRAKEVAADLNAWAGVERQIA